MFIPKFSVFSWLYYEMTKIQKFQINNHIFCRPDLGYWSEQYSLWYFLKREQMSLDDLIWNNTAGLLITWSLYLSFKLGSNSTWNSLSVQRANLKLQFSLVAEIKLRFSRQIRHISEFAHLINIYIFLIRIHFDKFMTPGLKKS